MKERILATLENDKDRCHRVYRQQESHLPIEIIISREDKRMLRELGSEVAGIGSLAVQKEKRDMWSRLNRLEAVKPMVWFSDMCWNEMDVNDELVLKTSSLYCRRIETELRQTIYRWHHMAGDMVVDPVVYSPLAVHNTGIGTDCGAPTTAADRQCPDGGRQRRFRGHDRDVC